MVSNLHTFLADWEEKHPEEFLHIDKEISVKWEITALQDKLEKMGKYPIIVCKNPVTVQGKKSDFQLITNLMASRRRCATVLGMDARKVAMQYAKKSAERGKTEIVSKRDAPVKEVVEKEENIDLFKFPHPHHHRMDPGPYIAAGLATTYDPETGIHNCCFQRLWVKQKDKTGYQNANYSHNWRNVLKFWDQGQDAPVAVYIGHHLGALLGANMKLDYPEDHYPVMAATLGEPLRLVPTDTFGDKLLVPADAEIIIEGLVPRDHWEAEGPFGEYHRRYGNQVPAMVINVKCVTYRKDAIYHDLAPGKADHLMPGVFPIEARLWHVLKGPIPDLENVHVPVSGGDGRSSAYLQFKKRLPEVGRDGITMALSGIQYSLKHVYAFDDDIDIFNPLEILWALTLRSYKGGFIELDSFRWGYKGGLDCTKPAPSEPGVPPLQPILNDFPKEILERVQIENYVKKSDANRIPVE